MENAGKADCFVWQSINAYVFIFCFLESQHQIALIEDVYC